jgi:DMSO/TMAO reductase YedYZ molybdopterin-dependent catalytic subunit
MSLPPGQRRVDGFPRFGTHFATPPPAVPDDPAIEIRVAGSTAATIPVEDLAGLPRRNLTADFHCVAGWTATDLHWGGVAFETLYRTIIEPTLPAQFAVSHVVFRGLDGYRSIILLDDALAGDVLVADRLDGKPLDGDHGAPVRIVSPQQYGFVSTKHLCGIELHAEEPHVRFHSSPLMQLGLQVVSPHPRARVWREERHRYLPAWLLRPVYRLLIPPIRSLSSRGSGATAHRED